MHLTETEVPIQPILLRRWSPYALAGPPVSHEDLAALFEAARWTPSSRNEQPWAFVVTERGTEEFERAVECLVEGNRGWARHAGVLAFAVSKKAFDHNGAVNRTALYDLGAAAAHLTFEATARGLFVHQMGGILPEEVRRVFAVPDSHEPVTGIAIGHLGASDGVPESNLVRDAKRRGRKPSREFAFGGSWGHPAPWMKN